MKQTKKYLRTKIVCNFFHDACVVINKQLTIISRLTNDNKKIHTI